MFIWNKKHLLISPSILITPIYRMQSIFISILQINPNLLAYSFSQKLYICISKCNT